MIAPDVVLLYAADCPNVESTRANLREALTATGAEPRWQERDVTSLDTPESWRGCGSPTVLINGADLTGEKMSTACCRLYHDTSGLSGTPPVPLIVKALQDSAQASDSDHAPPSRWQTFFATLPGIGIALLPKLACPVCWPAYSGLLAAAGLGFLLKSSYALLLTMSFLGLTVGALAFRAQRRRGYQPFLVGVFASLIVVVGKFVWHSEPVLYIGIGLLVIASVWNSWPRSRIARTQCSRCFERPKPKGVIHG